MSFEKLGKPYGDRRTRAYKQQKKRVRVEVPDEDFDPGRPSAFIYIESRDLAKNAIMLCGLERGLSMLVSGVTSEMCRHMNIEDARNFLHGFADTLPKVAGDGA